MREYKQEEIEELIRCPKVIIEAPRKEMYIERAYLRNDLKLREKNGERIFKVFMRQTVDFPEDFTIGIEYIPDDERDRIILLRCNGPHGEFEDGPCPPSSHFMYHIHKAKEENIRRRVKPERFGEATEEYAAYEQALSYFIHVVNITDSHEHEYFKGINQMEFDFPGDEIE